MAEVVAYLRREKETLEVQASLAAQEAARWKGQAAHAERAAAEARQVRYLASAPGSCIHEWGLQDGWWLCEPPRKIF